MKPLQYLLIPLLMASCAAQAATLVGDSITVNFTGHLTNRSPCTVGDDKVIEVPFGNVGVNKVDTGQFIQTVPYTLECGSAAAGDTVKMKILATPVAAENSAMASSVNGLWIRFLKDDARQPLNEEFDVPDWHNPPKLEIQLAKDPAVDLTAAAFTATATLTAEYL